MNKINVATVFSGIGSVEHALHRLNISHDIIFACDIDKYCKQTYFENFKISKNQWYNDVKTIDGKKYNGKIDLFVGGSPCQSFSMVGKRKGLEDDRGNLFFEFARLVDEIKPKVFIFENVKGLLSHDNGKTFEKIESRIKELRYKYYKKILNAKDYGIPQNRERLFVIGFLEDRDFNFPNPIKLEITMQDLLLDNPDLKYFLTEKGIKFVSDEKNLNKKYTQINGKIALCQKRNQQFNWHGDFVMDKYFLSEKVKKYVLASGTGDFYSKPETDLEIARPLLSTMAKMHRAGVDNYITRGNRLRKLIPRECLRLMGFSDEFKIVVSDTQAYKQAGNSIVVDVLMHILKCIYGIKRKS